uniref:RRM domain-containing protein n=1 Tax=Proboscia inermis TaxID=420281 RepID=A0A7S0C8Y9_9STRA|mmetsp:Transcript_3332/g.3357  ORF Transcript_3332/g.3357 Transcript_3332/m.3357 type:complete len:291 (+) Transcript_3332:115-987(+)
METDGSLSLTEDGLVKLSKSSSKKSKKDKKKKKKGKKREREEAAAKEKKKLKVEGDDGDGDGDEHETEPNATNATNTTTTDDASEKNKPCKDNPTGTTRLFLGNLPFTVDDTTLSTHVSPAIITHIKWITDKESGRFYGSAFIEMRNSIDAAHAVGISGSELLGRPIKLNYAPAREGDQWPPASKVITGGPTGGQAGTGKGVKTMSAKPDNCTKLFIGNLSYDITDDGITKFFANVDAEIKAVRWLSHLDTGDFKGVGFVEFWNTEACEKGAQLNGKNLMGRPIRIDWTD